MYSVRHRGEILRAFARHHAFNPVARSRSDSLARNFLPRLPLCVLRMPRPVLTRHFLRELSARTATGRAGTSRAVTLGFSARRFSSSFC